MLVFPDFYPAFACIAGRCRHSCCRGWEIDIDAESLFRYDSLSGAWGERLRSVIVREDVPHFRLTAEECCPFLRPDGLCEMIRELGGESLCDICREHPRFYNELPGRTEVGLGMCCEEAVRLLLSGTEPLRLMAKTERGETPALPVPAVLERARVFAALRRRDIPLTKRMEKAAESLGVLSAPFDEKRTAKFLLTLERMDPEWTRALERLAESPEVPPAPEGIRYERIAEYFIFRHFLSGKNADARAARAQAAFLLTRLLSALERCCKLSLAELLRLCSSELEYSGENTAAVIAYVGELMRSTGPM